MLCCGGQITLKIEPAVFILDDPCGLMAPRQGVQIILPADLLLLVIHICSHRSALALSSTCKDMLPMHQIVCSMRESAILLIQAHSRRVLVMFKVKHLMLLRGDAECHMFPARLTMDSAARIPTMDTDTISLSPVHAELTRNPSR